MTQLVISTYGKHGSITTIDDASSEQVGLAISGLDGQGEIELMGEGTWLGIAGGPLRFFIGYLRDPDPQILQALADHPSGEEIEVIVGGQPTTLAPEYLVSPETAKAAAYHFLATGQPTPEVAWERM